MFTHIMVAVDVAEAGKGQRPLAIAQELAAAVKADLRLIHVRYMVESALRYIPPADLVAEEQTTVRELLALGREAGIAADRLSAVSPMGNIHDRVLLAAAEFGADLIVLGPHSKSLSKILLGTNASRIIQSATMSVLVAR